MSQICYSCPSLYFVIKKGNFLYFFSMLISTFDKIETKT